MQSLHHQEYTHARAQLATLPATPLGTGSAAEVMLPVVDVPVDDAPAGGPGGPGVGAGAGGVVGTGVGAGDGDARPVVS